MSTAKQEAIDLISGLPDECSLADIMAELYFKQKVEKGLNDIEEGRVLSHDDVRERMARWARSIGQ